MLHPQPRAGCFTPPRGADERSPFETPDRRCKRNGVDGTFDAEPAEGPFSKSEGKLPLLFPIFNLILSSSKLSTLYYSGPGSAISFLPNRRHGIRIHHHNLPEDLSTYRRPPHAGWNYIQVVQVMVRKRQDDPSAIAVHF